MRTGSTAAQPSTLHQRVNTLCTMAVLSADTRRRGVRVLWPVLAHSVHAFRCAGRHSRRRRATVAPGGLAGPEPSSWSRGVGPDVRAPARWVRVGDHPASVASVCRRMAISASPRWGSESCRDPPRLATASCRRTKDRVNNRAPRPPPAPRGAALCPAQAAQGPVQLETCVIG